MPSDLDVAWGLEPAAAAAAATPTAAATPAAAASPVVSARVAAAEATTVSEEHAQILALLADWRREQSRHTAITLVVVCVLFAAIMQSLDRLHHRLPRATHSAEDWIHRLHH